MIDISAPLGDVDVNVHPSKAEVKFLREQAIFGAVQKAVRAALLDFSPVRETRRFDTSGPERSRIPVVNSLWPDPLEGSPLLSPPSSETEETLSESRSQGDPPVKTATESTAEVLTPRQTLPVLRLLGQAHETYLIAEGPEGIYLIDQHAAHERVLFEEISWRIAESAVESQQLLVPETMELQMEQSETLEKLTDQIAALGFVVEPFGPQTVMVRAVPRMLKDGSPTELLTDLLDIASEGGDVSSWQQKMVASLACHSSVTAGKKTY